MTTSPTEQEIVARAICKSRTCEGINCCQWPAQTGRRNCPVTSGGYDDAAQAAISALDSHRAKNAGEVEQMLRFIDADVYEHEPHTVLPWLDRAANLITSLRSIIREKDEALKPFAEAADIYPLDHFQNTVWLYPSEGGEGGCQIGDLRRARSSLSDGVK